mmetsp:Transcript_14843/g.22246  ORF Transcript_14843/g.22246 Transcript_14843/m.22246 type:complete len:221 (+) Transcript_14843:537-1199(+)
MNVLAASLLLLLVARLLILRVSEMIMNLVLLKLNLILLRIALPAIMFGKRKAWTMLVTGQSMDNLGCNGCTKNSIRFNRGMKIPPKLQNRWSRSCSFCSFCILPLGVDLGLKTHTHPRLTVVEIMGRIMHMIGFIVTAAGITTAIAIAIEEGHMSRMTMTMSTIGIIPTPAIMMPGTTLVPTRNSIQTPIDQIAIVTTIAIAGTINMEWIITRRPCFQWW